jgi:hypothetical protein
MRRVVFGLLASAGLIAVLIAARFIMAVPSNESVALRFNQKRAVYEQLRDMLLEDTSLRQVAPWGVRTATNPIAQVPPVNELTADRYQKYKVLLSDIGASGMTRSDGDDPNICILVWASGWAADTSHVLVCQSGHDAPPPDARWSVFSLGDRWAVKRDDMQSAGRSS